MRLVHESADGSRRVLATDVETADSVVEKAVGLMGRSSIPDDYALLFEFEPGPVERLTFDLPGPLSRLTGGADYRSIHMLFVRFPIDVIWLDDGEVVQVRTLDPWRGLAGANADAVVEMAAGNAEGVTPGDRILIEETDDDQPADGTRRRHSPGNGRYLGRRREPRDKRRYRRRREPRGRRRRRR